MSLQELINKFFYFEYLAKHSKDWYTSIYYLDRMKHMAELIDDWYSPEDEDI